MLSRLSVVVVAILCALASLCAAQTCASANTNRTSGYNTDCPNGYPYCLGAECKVCNPYLNEAFYCDCPSGQGCNSDTTMSNAGTCGATLKYGTSCSVDTDCTATYNGVVQIKMPCISGVCRFCDPAGNVTHVCDSRSSQYPQTKVCGAPGVWINAGSAATASGSTTTTATTAAQGSSTTSTSAAPDSR